jgi:F-type H+-transporting ATPase subunit delta
MSNLRIANRYAEALITSAEVLKLLRNVGDDLAFLKRIIDESNEFKLFLKSPIIKTEKKQQVFEEIFGKTLQPLTLRFLILLAEKGRESVLPEIIKAFINLQDERLGIANVHVKAAAELSAQQTIQLQQKFEEYSKKKVRVDVNLNPELIGGFVAYIGDTMFDGSVKHQLELLRKKFTEASTAV